MKIDDKLSQVFDIEPAKTEIITKEGELIPVNENKETVVEDDFDKTRNNLHSLLYQGQDALNHALEVAKSSEHPRAFEVVSNMMKQMADINSQLLELHRQKKELTEPSKNEAKPTTVNNNAIFVGSTTELNKLIQNMTKGD